jgi:uncharacterized cupin superfamily protein
MPVSFAVTVADAILEEDPLDVAAIVAGEPQTSNLVVDRSDDGRVIRGIWECSEGVFTDVEADEMFVIVQGRATIEVDGGQTLEVGPGDMGILEAGARTRWTVHETLRKAYQITLPE